MNQQTLRFTLLTRRATTPSSEDENTSDQAVNKGCSPQTPKKRSTRKEAHIKQRSGKQYQAVATKGIHNKKGESGAYL